MRGQAETFERGETRERKRREKADTNSVKDIDEFNEERELPRSYFLVFIVSTGKVSEWKRRQMRKKIKKQR